MKEYCGVSFNPYLVDGTSGEFSGGAEIILIYSEPIFSLGIGGLDRSKGIGSFRLALSASGLRDLAKNFLEYAIELDDMERRANARPVQP